MFLSTMYLFILQYQHSFCICCILIGVDRLCLAQKYNWNRLNGDIIINACGYNIYCTRLHTSLSFFFVLDDRKNLNNKPAATNRSTKSLLGCLPRNCIGGWFLGSLVWRVGSLGSVPLWGLVPWMVYQFSC